MGKCFVVFIVVMWCMLRVGGILVFEFVKVCVFSNKLFFVEDVY